MRHSAEQADSDTTNSRLLFDENEILGTSTQNEDTHSTHAETSSTASSDQESTIEANSQGDNTPSTKGDNKNNPTSPDEANQSTSHSEAEQTASPNGANQPASPTRANQPSSRNTANQNISPPGASQQPSPQGPKQDKQKRKTKASTKGKKPQAELPRNTRSSRQRTKVDYETLHTGRRKSQREKTDNSTTSTTNDETERMATQLEAYQHDNDKQQQELTRQQATIQQQENQIADLKREITLKENKSASIATVLKQQLKNKDDEITNLKETKATEKRKEKDAEKEKDKAIAKLEATKKDLDQANKEITDLKTELAKTKEEKDDIQTRLAETEQINDHLLKQYMSKDESQSSEDSETNTTPQRPKIMIIADSNRKNISRHLDITAADWSVVNTVYDVNELKDFVNSKESAELKNQEAAIIMLGTNDIRGSMGRKETSGNRVYEKLIETANKIKNLGPQVAITQIPPMTQPDHDIQAAVLNTRLESSNNPGIHIITHNIRKNPKEKTLERDGFHLSNLGGQIIAHVINENAQQIITTNEPQPQTEDIRIHKIETTQEKAKFVIGKQGNRIRTLKEKYNVNINTENNRIGNQSTCTITIKGSGANTNDAADEIHQIIDNAQHTLRKALEEKEERDKDKEVCRFYLRGECDFGLRCRNAHPADAQQERRGRTPKRHRSPSSHRTTSRHRTPTRPSSSYKHQKSPRRDSPNRPSSHRRHESPKPSTSYDHQGSYKPSSRKYHKKETITKLGHH